MFFFFFFDTVGAILFYVDDVVLFSKSGSCLQRFLNKLFEFCTFFFNLDVKLSKSKIVIFGCNKLENETKRRFPYARTKSR